MADLNQNYTLYQGEDRRVIATIRTDEDITNWTFVATYEHSFTETKFTCDAQVTDAVAKEVTIYVNEADTLNEPEGTYQFSLWRTDVGDKTPVSLGTVEVEYTSLH